jgi:preprotein translocase subunit YajC
MTSLPAVVLLQADSQPGSGLIDFFPFIMIFVIFYLLLIRPQQKKQREREQMLKAVEKGDSVVTAGGLHGKVVGTSDETLTLEIAVVKGERIRVKVDRARIESREQTGKGDDS